MPPVCCQPVPLFCRQVKHLAKIEKPSGILAPSNQLRLSDNPAKALLQIYPPCRERSTSSPVALPVGFHAFNHLSGFAQNTVCVFPVVYCRLRSAAMLPGIFVTHRRASISTMHTTPPLAFDTWTLARLPASGLCAAARNILKILYCMGLFVTCCHRPHLAPRQVKYSSCR